MITAALTRLDAEIDSIEAHAQEVYLGNGAAALTSQSGCSAHV